MAEIKPDWAWQSEFDGKEDSCGILLYNLAMHFRALTSGTVVLIAARDPSAPTEMASWCRMTGHDLLDHRHPHYLVRAK